MGGKPRARDGALLVVDLQNGFINQFTHHLPARVARLIRTRRFDPIYFTRFENPPGGPYRRFLDWDGCARPPETDLAPEVTTFAAPERVFSKPGYAGLPDALALVDCCASTAGLQAHLAGLAVLARNIGALRLVEAGLGDGRLGAPDV
jgi:nicotinamidase-related amidase